MCAGQAYRMHAILLRRVECDLPWCIALSSVSLPIHQCILPSCCRVAVGVSLLWWFLWRVRVQSPLLLSNLLCRSLLCPCALAPTVLLSLYSPRGRLLPFLRTFVVCIGSILVSRSLPKQPKMCCRQIVRLLTVSCSLLASFTAWKSL